MCELRVFTLTERAAGNIPNRSGSVPNGASSLDDGMAPSPLDAYGPSDVNGNTCSSPKEGHSKREDVGSDSPGADGGGGNANGGGGGVVKANKGMILRKSVEYIRCVFSAF